VDRAKLAVELQSLRDKLESYNYHYYVEDAPLVTDAEYDELLRQLNALEEQLGVVNTASPTQKVGGKVSAKFPKVKHEKPMLSLSNIFDEQEIDDFLDKVRKFLNLSTDAPLNITAEPKIDGLSFAAIYEAGVLKVASTRGDGEYGEDITANMATVASLPKSVPFQGVFEVRGEVYITKGDFLQLNEERAQRGEALFANPRNAAAGSLRQLDVKVTASRPLKYYVWGVI
jgi:DNA ligase (NAD+)